MFKESFTSSFKVANIKFVVIALISIFCSLLLYFDLNLLSALAPCRLPVLQNTSNEVKRLKNDPVCLSVLYRDIFEQNASFPTRKPDLTSDMDVLNVAKKGCLEIFNKYSFVVDLNHVKEEEMLSQVAYSIVVHKNVHQLLHLLSAIYNPQNVYCIHVDSKSPKPMFSVLKEVEKCLSNVFLSRKREYVVYASISRLLADLNCMEDLLNVSAKWNYLINLSGQDFPLKTNLEIVRKLNTLQGRNVIAGQAQVTEMNQKRTKFVHRIENRTIENGLIETFVEQTKDLKSPPPFNMTVRKNLAYNIYTRAFLHWVLFESEKAKALLEWSQDTLTPDEHFWLMLDSQNDAPGGSGRISWFSLTPYVKWHSPNSKCAGYYKHSICVFAGGDVKSLLKANKFFANKFDVTYDSLPVTCIRKLLDERRLLT